ncbi:MAG: amidohydrolase family protein [Spirochaetes bacterium]|nr:amidohydrolase family protein [Spirochaetota bacterium]
MAESLIINARILEDEDLGALHDIFMSGGLIKSIRPAGSAPPRCEPRGEVTDAGGAWVAPGFVDIHTHGGMGADVMDEDADALGKIARFHLGQGTTTFLATTLTAPLAEIQGAIDRVRVYRDGTASGDGTRADCLPRGSRIAGVHLEGPFLSPRNAGAQDLRCLRVPDGEGTDFILRNVDLVRRLTIAPDLPGAVECIAAAAAAGIGVAAGHDASIEEEIYAAIGAGLESVTHIYCCSSGISRREGPRKHLGLTEVGMADDRLTVEVIADGLHTPEALFSLIWKAKGPDRICLVSDSIRVAGMPDGEYRLGDAKNGQLVIKSGREVSIPGLGVYAGSATTIAEMVVRVVGRCGLPLGDVVHMATAVPARLARLYDRGSLAEGKLADINILKEDGSVRLTFLGGERV